MPNKDAQSLLMYAGKGVPAPAPFDKMQVSVTAPVSMYNNAGKAAAFLFPSVLNAFNKWKEMRDDPEDDSVGGVAEVGQYYIGEVPTRTPGMVALVQWDYSTGETRACVYDKALKQSTSYSISRSNSRDGNEVVFTMFPFLMQDEEFAEAVKAVIEGLNSNPSTVSDQAYVMSDNVYRRLTSEKVGYSFKRSPDFGPESIKKLVVDNHGLYQVLSGNFQVLASVFDDSAAIASASSIPADEFAGQYQFHTRTLTPEEQTLVPKIPDWVVIPEEAKMFCEVAQKSTGRAKPKRNFMFTGPAGTGKTQNAMTMAAGFNLPYVAYTCNSDTEIFDFIGSMMPVTAQDADKKSQEEFGNVQNTFASNIDLDQIMVEIMFDPASAYEKITGKEKADANEADCMHALMGMRKTGTDTFSDTSGQQFHYVETDFIRALRNGWVVEIQEPATIAKPGVLGGLNRLLEQDGQIMLPTGETITRHPDAVVIVTTNLSYAGCASMNQSVIDRMNMVAHTTLPDTETILQRTMGITGFKDVPTAKKMGTVIEKLTETMNALDITDGEVGVRSLIDWMDATMDIGDPYKAALYTVIAKASLDKDDRDTLREQCLDPYFPQQSR